MARFGDSTVAETTLGRYAEVFDELRLVVRAEDEALAELAAPYATIIKTEQAHLGMGHSLAAGFEKLPWQWAFVGLLDMPFVKVATLKAAKAARCVNAIPDHSSSTAALCRRFRYDTGTPRASYRVSFIAF